MKRIRVAAFAAAFSLQAIAADPAPGAAAPAAAQRAALHLDWLDRSADPLKDFNQYANGQFIRDNPVPPAYVSWGQFNILNERNHALIHKMLEEAAADRSAPAGSERRKLGDFYAVAMDEAAVEKAGIKPLAGELRRIGALHDAAGLPALMAHLQTIGVDPGFGITQTPDFTDSTRVIAIVLQGGLGLPDRDYYLSDDAKFAAIRATYEKHIASMLGLLGEAPTAAAAHAHDVLALETRLAKASMPREQQRDPHAIYNMRDRAQLATNSPALDWPAYLAGVGLPGVQSLDLAMPDFFAALSREMRATPIAVWQGYLRWQLVHAYAPFLSKAYVEENFHLRQLLLGSKELLPRWRRVLGAANGSLGFAIGHEFVRLYFPPEAREQVLAILHNVRGALAADLKALPWMGEKTRAQALDKLALIEERIGYPDKWRDYSSLQVDRGSYVGNVMRANAFQMAYDLAKVGKPVDRADWDANPQDVNASYEPTMNNITFLAGILQPPFFDPAAPAAVNYGAIGAVIGHEITHGFDDEGSQFDGHGNLVNWWESADREHYQAGVRCIVEQYSSYTVDGGLHLKGELVSGESIADLGGLLLAYRAFQDSPERKASATIDGFTPEQQFFLAFAHYYAGNLRPETARLLAVSDPHPPDAYRVNGTLANVPQFEQAFGAAPDPGRQRCTIW
jgi:putative endopeptidase